MPMLTKARAHWFATSILPLEPQLRAWLRRAVPHGLDVNDFIQEAYANLASLPADAEIKCPKAYLYTVTKRLIAHEVRRLRVIPIGALTETAELEVLESAFTPEQIVSSRQQIERLHRAISALPSPCRTVFMMRKFHDMSQKAIAAQLCISENAVEKRMSRALRKLVEYMQLEDSEKRPLAPQQRRVLRLA
jgi:RNA polymerase sigma factor (sigma-70 family)